MPEKAKVQADFARAAENYGAHADLQKTVAEELVKFSGNYLADRDIIDLGSGTGYLKEILQTNQITEVDIAFAMCRKSAEKGGVQINADMENLPFKNAAFAAAISSMALQWLDGLKKVFAETARVIQPGGIFAFAVVGEGTLYELSESLEKCGAGKRTNNFFSAEEIKDELRQDFILLDYKPENIINHYRDIFDLQRKIRAIGARRKGMATYFGKEKALMVDDYYRENYSADGRIRATWKLHYFVARKR